MLFIFMITPICFIHYHTGARNNIAQKQHYTCHKPHVFFYYLLPDVLWYNTTHVLLQIQIPSPYVVIWRWCCSIGHRNWCICCYKSLFLVKFLLCISSICIVKNRFCFYSHRFYYLFLMHQFLLCELAPVVSTNQAHQKKIRKSIWP